MKSRISIFFLLIALSVTGFSQVEIRARSFKESANRYLVILSVTMTDGFRVYGENTALNVTAPLIQFTNADVPPVKFVGEPQKFKDPFFENKQLLVYKKAFTLTGHIMIHGPVPAKLQAVFSGLVANTDSFIPLETKFNVDLLGGVTANAASLKIASIDVKHPLNGTTGKEFSTVGIFILGFLGGLLALLTPCVFPMIPVTVSFFTAKSDNRRQAIKNGWLYGSVIFLIYLSASIPFHLIKNIRPELLNNIATNVPVNVLFFLIFLCFALSFFGLFEIKLPSSIANRANQASGLGTFTGIFFMALTLVIVSFSCTGPILGSLLVGSIAGGAWLLTAGLAGFGLALALPFGLLAMFPQLLKRLPRSGEWLTTFKTTMAFFELALAFKFLSNADLVGHWGILTYKVFLAIWILIALALGIYLFARNKVVGSLLALSFAGYVLWGLYGHTLSFLSGFPPPESYGSTANRHPKRLEADVVNDYEKALAMARTQHKKLLIDFTGWACVNCRKMEENVWTDPTVARYIRQNYILVSLYVDDKEMLAPEDRNDSCATIGDRFARFQALNFGQASQPLYAVLNTEQQLMSPPQAYESDANKFLTWLQKADQ